MQQARAKAHEKPAYPPGFKPQRLAAGYAYVNTNNQTNFLVRVLYFCAIGWWAGYFWACVGYGLVCSIILMPIGLMMLNRLPAVLTLRKN
ncbi:hypothetical protein KDW_42380 [Dictyobacter vulcani]|uniref:Uncharacterized protein n=1 Tax=Dictyobacter vulcani TaxID=2607529 RepID=A0A5J4KY61_9CHLR|nr:hypothetical protein [Dictyobacter vulcani]GER90076.1 hypothetical protein KDW_42380 [Dictyobacter vulcani]